MDPHPVPQNILEVEFKLFGAFTLKQFLKIMLGCLVGLAVFITKIPLYIKYPIIGASVITGVGLAIVPNFGVWLSGFLKALFISPRYVWVKETHAPELLTNKPKANVQDNFKVTTGKKKNPVLSEVSLERLLSSTGSVTSGKQTMLKEDEDQEDRNLDKLMAEIQATRGDKKVEENLKKQESKEKGHGFSLFGHKGEHHEQRAPVQKDKEYYLSEINKLKYELANLVKDQNYKTKEVDLLHRINDLYQEVKFASEGVQNPVRQVDQSMQAAPVQVEEKMPEVQQEVLKDEKGSVVGGSGQTVFGVVVDKSDKPVAGADISFDNPDNDDDFATVTGSDGRFASNGKIPNGTYDISVKHGTERFHTYKIVVGKDKMPAYKLRAK